MKDYCISTNIQHNNIEGLYQDDILVKGELSHLYVACEDFESVRKYVEDNFNDIIECYEQDCFEEVDYEIVHKDFNSEDYVGFCIEVTHPEEGIHRVDIYAYNTEH